MRNKTNGFTLIELLIVVAIIAILAAIAIPNFLQAQVRSKVSRAMADMQSLATAVEAYDIDNNTYPFPTAKDPTAIFSYAGNGYTFEGIPQEISTPIAYISSAVIQDPFAGLVAYDEYNRGLHTYHFADNVEEDWRYSETSPAHLIGYKYALCFNAPWNYQVEYVLWSHGPDLVDDFAQIPNYDPTNGTVSTGDVTRFGP